MKHIVFIFIVMCLISCTSPVYNQGESIGEQLCAISISSSYDKLPTFIDKYNRIEDSINAINPNDVPILNSGIINKTENENDTIRLAARIIMGSPQSYGAWLADKSIEAIDKAESLSVLKYIKISHFIYSKTGESSSIAEFEHAFQAHIDSLDVSKQMLIYSSVTTPSSLGLVLGKDAVKSVLTEKSVGKMDTLNMQLKEIEKLYVTGSKNWQEFVSAFNSVTNQLSTIERKLLLQISEK